ncbi:unnamed protein product [Effrenium voratum]|uniref:Uncharacterized protein n=1 Tax=Effrenium voratum TaxID=2562239 RepID=A0AA36MQ06_9DINO|nr:unnamed protein product [Effrenium voratum]
MAALGLDQVLELANEYDAQGNEGRGEGAERERRRGRGQARRQPLGRGLRQRNQRANLQARRAGARFAVKKRQLVLQSEHFNKTGQARTQDHQLPDAELSRKVATGRHRPGKQLLSVVQYAQWAMASPPSVAGGGLGPCNVAAEHTCGVGRSKVADQDDICRGAGCCSGREEAVDKAEKLIVAEILKPMPLPAMNKWNKAAFKAEFGALRDDEESNNSNSEDAKLEVPINEAKKWRILARRRNMRATNFLAEPQSLWINLLWCHLACSSMALRAMLFKNAAWFSDRSPRELSRPRHLLGIFCDPDTNPAWANLQELLDILENPEQRLPFLVWKFGPVARWPQARRRIVRKAIMVMTGQLARKLILPWKQYPWRLWPLALQDVDERERQACAQALLSSKPCCLDSGFSKRLKALHPRESELLSAEVRSFLDAAFARVTVTSTFIERYNVFLSDFRKNLRAQDVGGDGGRANFAQDATAAWRSLSAADKASYSLRARGINGLRKRSAESLEEAAPEADESGGLWGMCNLQEKWPISSNVLRADMGEERAALKDHQALIETDDDLPDASDSLFSVCPHGGYEASLGEDELQVYREIHDDLVTAFRAHEPLKRDLSAHPLILQWRSSSKQQQRFAAVAFNVRKAPWDMVMLQLEPQSDSDGSRCPFVLKMQRGRGVRLLRADIEFCNELARSASEMRQIQRAARAAKLAQGLVVAAKRQKRGQGRRRGRGQRPPPLQGDDDLSFSEGWGSDSASEAEEVEANPASSSAGPGSASSSAGPGSAAAASSGPAPPVKSKLQSRAIPWGPFQIAPIVPAAGQSGWGAIGGQHCDQGNTLSCKKAVSRSSTLTDADCVLRLKRWLLAGHSDQQWPSHRRRSHHVELGGKGLQDFADGMTEAEMDELVASWS